MNNGVVKNDEPRSTQFPIESEEMEQKGTGRNRKEPEGRRWKAMEGDGRRWKAADATLWRCN